MDVHAVGHASARRGFEMVGVLVRNNKLPMNTPQADSEDLTREGLTRKL